MAASTWAIPALVALCSGALYVRYANPAVGGGNTGEFQVMAPLLGIAHPPSYPLFLLLAKVAALLPFGGDVAWRINVLNALLAALAIFGVGLLARGLARPQVATLVAVLAGTLVAAMPRLWTLAVEAEVFSLHLALVVAFWLCIVTWQRTARDRWLLAASLCAGLGLANHRTFLFFIAGGALTVLLRRPAVLLRMRLIAACAALAVAGLAPYVYVLRGLVWPVAYFSPTDVHRLTRGEAWYVLQGNAEGETGGGRIVLSFLADHNAVHIRTLWLWRNLVGQFGIWGTALTVLGIAGVLLLLWRQPGWTLGALIGGLGAALFAMAYGKYPDGDRYLLPLETVLALGAATVLAEALGALDRLLQAVRALRPVVRPAGVLFGAGFAAYALFSFGVLAGQTQFTRGGYVYFTLFNLDAVQPDAVVCTWWASAWGWWYAQYVDGHRMDVALVPKGPDDCVRDVVPDQFGRRSVYIPALTDKVKASDYVFFPSRNLWVAVARRTPLADGDLLKGPDDKVYFYTQGQRRWVATMDAFNRHDFSWDRVQLVGDYTLKDIPEGPPLE
jgi:hypothetical protein